MDILQLLSRPDKHYLGGGNRVVWTPPFPVWLDKPGFWDKANFYNFDMEPVFTITLLNEHGCEIPLDFQKREWNPARLKQIYATDAGFMVNEEKAITPDDSLISVFTLRNETNHAIELHYIAWTTQKSYPSKGKEFIDNLDLLNDKIIFTKFLQVRDLPLCSIHCAFGLNEVINSFDVNFSQATAVHPVWQFTPFYDHFSDGKLNNSIKISGISQDGLIYLALHKKITLPPAGTHKIQSAMAYAKNDDDAAEQLNRSLRHDDPIALSEKNWRRYFAGLPQFHCSDPLLTRYYWYRWYGLRLFTIQGGGESNYAYPAVCEGVSYFRVPITYSAQCHILETRWMQNPEIAHGSLLNFINMQKEDGSFVGHIYPNGVQTGGFYHANWGKAVLAVDEIHSDLNFLEQAYHGLNRYVAYFDRERDKEESGLYDVVDQFETGQEFMSRYQAVDDRADTYGWINKIRLKGIDATVYLYELKKMLAALAGKLAKNGEQEKWEAGATKIKQAVLKLMWDADEEMFFDVNPLTMETTGVKAAVCFYPYFTDIVDVRHIPGLKRHLLNPNEFWTPWPVPATSADDQLFNPDAEWKGKRHNCPWNGRVWPMTNSHIAEALATCALRFEDEELQSAAVTFITKFIRMMHFEDASGEKDSNRPNCYEHYHPFNGRASVYRGVDDYQHSWVVDLILKYVAGIQPGKDGTVQLKPLDFGLEFLQVDNLLIKGKKYSIRLKNGKWQIDAVS